MAKYCSNCGKELNKGQLCSCKEIEKKQISVFVNNFRTLLKGMFTYPVDTMKNFIQEHNFINALIAIGVNIVTLVILICIFLKEFASPIELFGNYSRNYFFQMETRIEIPYVRVILVTIIILAVIYALMSGIAYGISAKCFKSKTSYKKMVVWLGPTAAMMSVVYLVAAMCLLIGMPFATIVLVAGGLLNMYYMYQGLHYACNANKNYLGYILMLTILLTGFIMGYIVPRLLILHI